MTEEHVGRPKVARRAEAKRAGENGPDFPTGTLVGRAADLAALGRRIESARLVTVLGPAGVGKTSLARAFSRDRPDAVWCDLFAAASAIDVCASVARGLEIPIAASSTETEALAAITAALVDSPERLIVLDNYEHVLDTGAVAARLSVSARVLVTSQVRLGLPEEVVIDVAPLDAPSAEQLFLERARAVRHDYEPDDDERAAISSVCASLDGLPLAIELAAARIRVLSAHELATRIAARFEVLESTSPGASGKHATLRAALDWSWSLLDDDERSTLAQCSCFADGFDLEAAEAVIQSDRPILDVLQALRDKSLLTATTTQLGTRYGLYFSVRDYAAEHLDLHPKRDEIYRRHADHYLARGLLWAARSEGKEARSMRAHLETEQANLLLVLSRSIDAGHANDALTVALALQPVLMIRGPAALRRDVTDRARALAERTPDADRRRLGWARLASGDTAFGMGEMEEARRFIDAALDDAAAMGDERLRGRSLWRLGTLHWTRDALDDAETTLRLALDVHQTVGDRIHEGRCLTSLGMVAASRGALDEASDHFEAALDALEAVGDERWIGRTIGHLGAVEDARGHLDEARELYLNALAIHERWHNGRHIARVLGALAGLDLEVGNAARAKESLERARELERTVPNVRTRAIVTLQLGRVFEHEGDVESARQSYRRAARWLRQIDSRRLLAVVLLDQARLDDRPERRIEEAVSHVQDDDMIEALASIARGRPDDPRAAADRLVATNDVAKRYAEVRRAARRLRRALSDGLPEDALVIGDGWFKPPGGGKVEIAHRRAPAAILAALVAARERSGVLTIDELFDVGWPGERALPEAAKSRVYVAISTLRKLGLESVLIRDDTGYRLAPDVVMLRAPTV